MILISRFEADRIINARIEKGKIPAPTPKPKKQKKIAEEKQ
jgi:hypothetical protein